MTAAWPSCGAAHGEPDFMKLRLLAQFAKILGYPLKQCESRRDLQNLLNRVAGKPNERAINYALLRSLKQAEYTTADMGHYALGESQYCHFTSPIRRYPDLTVHRTVADVLFHRKSRRGGDVVELTKLARHCSTTERRAEKAERELVKVKLLTFFKDKVGLEMHATITGVERFGLFCQGVEIPAEGLVHITALDRDEFYDFDEATFSLVARRSGPPLPPGGPRAGLRGPRRHRPPLARFPHRAGGKKRPKKQATARPPAVKQRHPRSKRSERAPTPEESSALRARRREKKRRRADRRGG